jgi:hypothetical protein
MKSFGNEIERDIPASLPRKLVRLGSSNVYMRQLATAYEEILVAASEVRHDQLHTDKPDYDY